MDQQTAHRIQIVLCGIYRKKIGQTEHLVTMDAVSKTATGKLSGVLRVPGFPQETIHEDGTGATGWEFVGKLDDSVGFQADVLEQRIASLETELAARTADVNALVDALSSAKGRIQALEQQASKPKGR